jgi:general secretion pathway protein L
VHAKGAVTAMMSELKVLFEGWIAAVAAAVHAVVERMIPRRRILLVEGEDSSFAARVISPQRGATLPEAAFRLLNDRPEPVPAAEWLTALRGSRIDIRMRADQVLFREVDLPKQASDFLDAMIRAQIDRLTPWTTGDAVFGLTSPTPVANERIALTLAATSCSRRR